KLDATGAAELVIDFSDKSVTLVSELLAHAREEAAAALKGVSSFVTDPTKLDRLGQFVKGADAVLTAYQGFVDAKAAYLSLLAQLTRYENARNAYLDAVAKANAAIYFLDNCKTDHAKDPEPIPPPSTTVVNTAPPTIIRTSFDPNDKVGPTGFGAAGFVQPGTLAYEIEFENSATLAQIAAQQVVVTDTLDSDLDLTTFEFGEFGFGTRVFSVPAGLTHYETTIDLRPEGIDLLVPVTLDLNTATRVLTATFRTLDPLTALAPEGFEGFLPVNNAAHDGEGFLTYLVRPKSGLPTGTVITNQASIVFDVNAPILTPSTLNTLDVIAPTSTVAPLPAVEDSSSFTVNWSGSDDSGGSGVAFFDVFVSDNGGDLLPLVSRAPPAPAGVHPPHGPPPPLLRSTTPHTRHRPS